MFSPHPTPPLTCTPRPSPTQFVRLAGGSVLTSTGAGLPSQPSRWGWRKQQPLSAGWGPGLQWQRRAAGRRPVMVVVMCVCVCVHDCVCFVKFVCMQVRLRVSACAHACCMQHRVLMSMRIRLCVSVCVCVCLCVSNGACVKRICTGHVLFMSEVTSL